MFIYKEKKKPITGIRDQNKDKNKEKPVLSLWKNSIYSI